MLPDLVRRMVNLPATSALLGMLPGRGRQLAVGGLPGSSPAVLVAALSDLLPQRTFLLLCEGPPEAERWYSDLAELLGTSVALYPQREALGEEEPHLEIAGERVETVFALLDQRVRVLVSTVPATTELTRMARSVAGRRMELRQGDSAAFTSVVELLEGMGYERRPSVLDVAQFAVRGGIIDVYGFGMAAPARIEWWGDEIQSIRSFDLDSQRSDQEVEAVTVLPVGPVGRVDEDAATATADAVHRESLLDLLPPDTLLVVAADGELDEVRRVWDDAKHHLEVALRRGEDVPGRDALFLDPETWLAKWSAFARVTLSDDSADHDHGIRPAPEIRRDLKVLKRIVSQGPTLVLCDNEGQLERLEELLSDSDKPGERLPPNLILALGSLSAGFVFPELTVLMDHEVFNRARRIRRPRRYRQAIASDAVGALAPGDYVVHLDHGIGVYRGMHSIDVLDGGAMEVAVIEYEGGDRLNVPLYRLDQMEPYRVVSQDEVSVRPRIDRLGGTRWSKQRTKTEQAVKRLASELLELYAKRSMVSGFAFPQDTLWQKELESSFLYEDTPDQRTATEDTKRDMERPQPADRLIVGDVGYGKTEIAVRAAFKAVQAGKQAAVLVPTTILAEQHGRTFGDRLAEYPVRVEVLSRFRTSVEQRAVLEGLQEGTVDIVIGTHRLLSKDVQFRDLGLLVVDEEHRFGVKHKERLKALRLTVDVITLTATPIPRTLHLALSGLRDLTIMDTPPRDRSPVLTFVEPWDDELIEEALTRELDRGGQVYFVHNRIETIETVAERVRKLVPAGRGSVEVAHGRMRERELDAVMRRFVLGEIGVLVSTMIVESGLDVPNANTMIVHQAHQFGLAQLYQLRGRVGRGHRRAYCYLLVPDAVHQDAEQRLKILEHHTELGSGYRIALRDLELRGAGNLLGAEQSGYAHAVGYDLFMRWLNETVRALKGEAAAQEWAPPEVVFDSPTYLPDAYVPDDVAKLEFYRRLACAGALGEIAQLREELRDRFGPVPAEADRMLAASELRVLGGRLGLETVVIVGDEARLQFRARAAPKMMRLSAALEDVQFSAEVRRTVPLLLRLRRIGGIELRDGLVRALSVAAGDSGEFTAGAMAQN